MNTQYDTGAARAKRDAERDAIDRARVELRLLARSIPSSHSTWDVMRVREFKAAVVAGNKINSNSRATLSQLTAAANALRTF